jgi:hypothetical protein
VGSEDSEVLGLAQEVRASVAINRKMIEDFFNDFLL